MTAELSRRTFLALGATIVAGACSSDSPDAQPSTIDVDSPEHDRAGDDDVDNHAAGG